MAHIRRRRLSTGKAAYLAVWRTPEGRERARQFARRVDAQRWIHSVEVAKAEGRYVDVADARQTLGDWAQRCWDPMTGHLAPKSKARSDEVLRVHVLPRFGSTPLARIDKVAIAEWTTELHRECGLSPETVRKALWELSRLLAAAVDTKRLGTNPAKGLKLPKVERQEMRVLAPEEIWTLLDVLDHRFRAWGLLAAYSGLRAGELFGLRRGRFDALRAQVEVREELVDIGGYLHFETLLKSKAAYRIVPLPRLVAEEVASAIPPDAPGDHLVFHAPRGGPIRMSNFRNRILVSRPQAIQPRRASDPRPASHSRLVVDRRGSDAEGGPDVGGTRVNHDHLRPIRTPLSRYRGACHECARARVVARSRATTRRYACVMSAALRVVRPSGAPPEQRTSTPYELGHLWTARRS